MQKFSGLKKPGRKATEFFPYFPSPLTPPQAAKISFFKLLFISLNLILALQLSACSTLGYRTKDGAPKHYVDVSKIPDAVPKQEPLSKYGNPNYYYVDGKKIHVLKSAKDYNKVGFASWYGTKFDGQLTSSRERYRLAGMTAASRDLPIPTYVKVTNLKNGKSIIVKVNDRGPFVANRIIDLSYAAAKKLGYAHHGTTLVRVTAIDPVQWAAQRYRTPTTSTPSRNDFYLQVGAFASRANAENLRIRIASLTAAPVEIKFAQREDKTIYRVQVGPLIASESENLRDKLESQGLSAGIHVMG